MSWSVLAVVLLSQLTGKVVAVADGKDFKPIVLGQ